MEEEIKTPVETQELTTETPKVSTTTEPVSAPNTAPNTAPSTAPVLAPSAKSKKRVKQRKSALERFGKLFFVLAILGFVFAIAVYASSLLTLAFYLLAALIFILTLFQVNWFTGSEAWTLFLGDLVDAMPIVAGCIMGFSALAILFYALDSKNKKHKGKIIFASIIFVLAIFLLIMALNGNFKITINSK